MMVASDQGSGDGKRLGWAGATKLPAGGCSCWADVLRMAEESTSSHWAPGTCCATGNFPECSGPSPLPGCCIRWGKTGRMDIPGHRNLQAKPIPDQLGGCPCSRTRRKIVARR